MNELIRFLSTRQVEIFIMAVWFPLITTALASLLGTRPFLIMFMAIIFFLLYFLFLWTRDYRSRRNPPEIGKEEALKVARKAVIFTLGLNSGDEESVVSLVLKCMKPEWIGFLGSPATENAGIVKTISNKFALPAEKIKTESWEPTEINEGRVKTLLIIDWLLRKGLKPSDLVVDLTGGTATMSIAAFIAAQERAVDSQYIHSYWDSVKRRPIEGTQKALLVTRYGNQPPLATDA